MPMPDTKGVGTYDAVTETESATTGGGSQGQIRQVKEQVMDQAKTTFREARDKATSSLGDSRRQAAAQIGGIGSALHSASGHLRNENQERIAGLADSVGDQADRVARYLEDIDLDGLARDVEDLARRKPALVFGAALAIGIIGARFLKSSGSAGRRNFDNDYENDEPAAYERIQPGGDPAGVGLGGSRSFVDDVPPAPRGRLGGNDVGA